MQSKAIAVVGSGLLAKATLEALVNPTKSTKPVLVGDIKADKGIEMEKQETAVSVDTKKQKSKTKGKRFDLVIIEDTGVAYLNKFLTWRTAKYCNATALCSDVGKLGEIASKDGTKELSIAALTVHPHDFGLDNLVSWGLINNPDTPELAGLRQFLSNVGTLDTGEDGMFQELFDSVFDGEGGFMEPTTEAQADFIQRFDHSKKQLFKSENGKRVYHRPAEQSNDVRDAKLSKAEAKRMRKLEKRVCNLEKRFKLTQV